MVIHKEDENEAVNFFDVAVVAERRMSGNPRERERERQFVIAKDPFLS